jgi:hypothetical protein
MATTASPLYFTPSAPIPTTAPAMSSHARFIYPFSHHTPPPKRKIRFADSDDDDDNRGEADRKAASTAPPLRKRKKSSGLEKGFAHLSLRPGATPFPTPVDAYTVEEPPEGENVRPVKMKSWYEPEKDSSVLRPTIPRSLIHT